MNKKILLISQVFWPEIMRVNDIAQYLQNQNIEVDVLTGKPNYPFGKIFKGYSRFKIEYEEYLNIKIHRIPIIPRFNGRSFFLFLNYISFIILGSLLGPFIFSRKKYNSILVFATSPLLQALIGVLLSKIYKIKLIIWVQDLWPHSLAATGHIKNKYLLKIVNYFVKFIYKNSHIILVQSNSFISEIQKYNLYKQIIYLPNPSENFINSKKSEINFNQKKFNLVYAGNIGTVQSIETIVKAADLLKNNPKIQFHIFGNGKNFLNIKTLIVNSNIDNIIIYGQIDNIFIKDILKKSDALIFCLKKDHLLNKTIPAKLQTYMSIGKPIIAAIDGESSNIINDSNCGLTCKSENYKLLAKNIIKLSDLNIDELNNYGNNAIKFYAKNFNNETIISKLIKYL